MPVSRSERTHLGDIGLWINWKLEREPNGKSRTDKGTFALKEVAWDLISHANANSQLRTRALALLCKWRARLLFTRSSRYGERSETKAPCVC